MSPSGPPPFPLELLAPPDPAVLPLPAPARPAPGVRLLRGAVYAVPEGGRPLELDLWLPEGTTEPPPVIVFVHGGGWRTGLRDDMGPRFRTWRPGPFARLAQAGYAVACPDYRLSGEACFPAPLDDLTTALSWLHARAADLGLDTSRTVLWGESAGGHLAALTALTAPRHPGGPESPGGPGSPTVTGCVTWYTPTDLTALAQDHPAGRYDPTDPATFEALMIGTAPAEDPARARAASPVSHVTPYAPPFLVLHGTQDVIVPARQGVRLAIALRDAGVQVDIRLIEGADHSWVGLPEPDLEECFSRSLDFVRRRSRFASPR